MQGFARIFTTDKFSLNAAEQEAVQQEGRAIIAEGFAVMDGLLADKDYVTETFSITDAALRRALLVDADSPGGEARIIGRRV